MSENQEIYWWRPLAGESEADTRGQILQAAYREIHVNGFQAASLNTILAHTGVTKGALYHHFPNKIELGYAVIDEVIAKRIQASFIAPLEQADDPIAVLIDLIKQSGHAFTLRDIQLGCPLGNLAQEMGDLDPAFRKKLNESVELMIDAYCRLLSAAQKDGKISKYLDIKDTASFIVASWHGAIIQMKLNQSLQPLRNHRNFIFDHILKR